MTPLEFRRRLHRRPELSFEEHETAAFIERQLAEAGIPCRLAPDALRMLSAVGVCICAEAAAKENRLCSAAQLQPVYLRLSQAERERLQREAKAE